MILIRRIVFSFISMWCIGTGSDAFAIEINLIGSSSPGSINCPSDYQKKQISSHSPVIGDGNEVPDEGEVNSALESVGIANFRSKLDNITPLIKDSRSMRIGLWGDSHAAANFFSDALVLALGGNEKRIFPGFISPSIGNAGVRLPFRRSCKGDGWRAEHAYRNRVSGATWSRALTRIVSDKKDDYIWIDFRSSLLENSFNSLDIQLSRSVAGSISSQSNGEISLSNVAEVNTILRLSVNDDADQFIEFNSATEKLLTINSEYPISTLKITLVSGGIGIDGFIPNYNTPPEVLFDTMGVPGATAKGLQFLEPDPHARDSVRPYDLALIEFGTNEGNNSRFDVDSYSHDLRKSLTVFRQSYPSSTCILIGPTDRGVRVPISKNKKKKVCKGKGKMRKCRAATPVYVDLLRFSRIHSAISKAQAEVGKDFQCDAWSWQEAMGGQGGIYRWFYQKPSLAQRDLIHLTVAGYRYSANLFLEKLLGNPLFAPSDQNISVTSGRP
jgi:hypothetical protein